MTLRFKLARLHALAVVAILVAAAPCAAQDEAQENSAPTFKPEEIEQLVAPVALYPDPLLAQIFMASTYPLEIVEAARWATGHPDLKDKALEDALQQQTWDPSVKSLTAFPSVLTMMNDKLDWTQKLGDACLAQQDDVMAAVQRLRAKAKAEGNLETTKEQKVTVEPAPVNVEQNVNVQQAPAQQTIIKIEPADPQVIYVPTYNPTVVYGGWPYPTYPPYSYYPPGYVAATSVLSFGIGMAVGAALWGDCDWHGGYGYGHGGNNNIKINVNNYNSFNNTNIKNNNWQHNAQHRKGVGYRDGASQQRYGKGTQRGRNEAASRDAFRGRAASGRQDLARSGGGDRTAQRSQHKDAAAAKQGAAKPGGAGGSRDRAEAQRQAKAPRADAGAAAKRAGSRGGDAFQGMGNGNKARRDSSRGQASRQSASGNRGGGNRGGGRRR